MLIEADHLVARNLGVAVSRMRLALERQARPRPFPALTSGIWRRIEPDVPATLPRRAPAPSPARCRVRFEDGRCARRGHRGRDRPDLLVRWQADHRFARSACGRQPRASLPGGRRCGYLHFRPPPGWRRPMVRRFHRVGIGMITSGPGVSSLVDRSPASHHLANQPARHHEAGAAQVADLPDRLPARRWASRDNGTFRIAEDQKVRLRIRQHRTAHLVRPVIVMGDTRRLASCRQSPHWHRDRPHGSAASTRRPHGQALAGLGIRRASGRRDLGRGGKAIDHRVHVAGGDAVEQVGRPSAKSAAECQSGWLMMPTRKPRLSSSRPTSAMPKLGRSM